MSLHLAHTMTPITVRYTKTDFLRLGLHVALRSAALRWMSLAIAIMVLVLNWQAQGPRGVIGIIATILTMVIITAGYFVAMVVIMLLSALYRNRKGSPASEPQTYCLTEQGISRQSASSDTILKWGGARSLRRSNSAIYVGASATSFYILPRHAFVSEEDYDSWWNALKKLRAT